MRRVRAFSSSAEVSAEEKDAKRRGLRGFGAYVSQVREDTGLSRVDFAAKAHCDAAALAAIEDGRQRATVEWPRIVSAVTKTDYITAFDIWSDDAPDGELRMTVDEARSMIKSALGVGVDCPVCGRVCKESRRSVSKPMVRFARWLVSNHRGTPLDARKFVESTGQRGGDYAKLVFWGLAKREPGADPLWSPTPLGIRWVKGQAKVRRIAVVWRNEVLRFEGKAIGASDVEDEPVRPDRTGERQSLPGIE